MPRSCNQAQRLPDRRSILERSGVRGKKKSSLWHCTVGGKANPGCRIKPVASQTAVSVWWQNAQFKVVSQSYFYDPAVVNHQYPIIVCYSLQSMGNRDELYINYLSLLHPVVLAIGP
jgi:hypothetical protein